MKVIMLAGAGSVGKTKTLDALMLLAQRRSIRAIAHQSTTRQTYAKAGLHKESDALQDIDFNMKFQQQVMADNIDALLAKADKSVIDEDVLICDRSPHDYASYFTSVFADRLNLARLEERQMVADDTISALLNLSYRVEVHVFFLGYPAFWSRDTESSDGWRSDTTGKNWAWSTQCESMLRRTRLDKSAYKRFRLERLHPFFMNGDPDTRAIGIMSKVFPEWGP